MSGLAPTSFNDDSRPQHHIHRDSEPLPSRGTDTFGSSAPQNFGGVGQEGLGGMAGERSAAQAATAFHENQDMHRNAAFEVQGQNAYAHTMPSEDTSMFPENKHGEGLKRDEGMGGRHDAFHEARPMGVEPTRAGGVAVGGRDDLPAAGKATLGDKIIGKTEKVGTLMRVLSK
jgi:hypothetical protein